MVGTTKQTWYRSPVSCLIFCAVVMALLFVRTNPVGAEPAVRNLYSIANAPNPETPANLSDIWLRFHEEHICQDAEAVFVFRGNRMDLYLDRHNSRELKKLRKLLESLEGKDLVTLYLVHSPSETAEYSEILPPTSFWMNSTLRSQFSDPGTMDFFRFGTFHSATDIPPSVLFRKRMVLFAHDTLDYTRKMKSYAEHLPLLARAASDPDATPEIKRRIQEVYRDHARELEKYIGKLYGNIEKATPKPFEKPRITPDAGHIILKGLSSVDGADWIAAEARNQYFNVQEFIYPQNHTVDVAELRNPSLLRSLKTLQAVMEEYRKSIS